MTTRVFEGRLTATFGEGEKTVPLTHAWVEDNFEERYLQELKVVAATKKKFTMGPTGDCLDSSTLPSELELECAPKVRYQQGDKDLCAIYGPASALHYMNMREAAKTVAAMASDIVKNGGNASIVWRVAQKLNNDVLPAKLWVKTKLPWRSDVLSEDNDCIQLCANAPADTCFMVWVLRGTDESASHCVAVVKHWIFDSKALPLTRASLDWCCGSVRDDNRAKYESVESGYMFSRRPKKQRRKETGDLEQKGD